MDFFYLNTIKQICTIFWVFHQNALFRIREMLLFWSSQLAYDYFMIYMTMLMKTCLLLHRSFSQSSRPLGINILYQMPSEGSPAKHWKGVEKRRVRNQCQHSCIQHYFCCMCAGLLLMKLWPSILAQYIKTFRGNLTLLAIAMSGKKAFNRIRYI